MDVNTKLLVKILAQLMVVAHHESEIVDLLESMRPDQGQRETTYHNVLETGDILGEQYEKKILKEIDKGEL